jgi:hypothetical protein
LIQSKEQGSNVIKLTNDHIFFFNFCKYNAFFKFGEREREKGKNKKVVRAS